MGPGKKGIEPQRGELNCTLFPFLTLPLGVFVFLWFPMVCGSGTAPWAIINVPPEQKRTSNGTRYCWNFREKYYGFLSHSFLPRPDPAIRAIMKVKGAVKGDY